MATEIFVHGEFALGDGERVTSYLRKGAAAKFFKHIDENLARLDVHLVGLKSPDYRKHSGLAGHLSEDHGVIVSYEPVFKEGRPGYLPQQTYQDLDQGLGYFAHCYLPEPCRETWDMMVSHLAPIIQAERMGREEKRTSYESQEFSLLVASVLARTRALERRKATEQSLALVS